MAIKLKYDSLKEIPAEDVALYVEREGAWHLDADLKGTKLADFAEQFRAYQGRDDLKK